MKVIAILVFILASGLALATPSSDLQKIMAPSKSESKSTQYVGYTFVSTKMDDGVLTNLARQSYRYGFTLVLNGFGDNDLQTRSRIQQINRACCGDSAPTWEIYPQLFRAFKVTATPSFVIAKGETGDPNTFSKVAGSMSIQDALGIFFNRSTLPSVREAAKRIYQTH